ncbi:hypothetical protein CFP56_027165 [Quercus suber]|uniref:Uncharacterized protein n=1 Tax=Quercus suber TaxID=58331 RepID=A0AAW0JXH8_QUESU
MNIAKIEEKEAINDNRINSLIMRDRDDDEKIREKWRCSCKSWGPSAMFKPIKSWVKKLGLA